MIFLSSQLYTVILEKNWEGSFPCSASLLAVAIAMVSNYNYFQLERAQHLLRSNPEKLD
jgi:hypothetical protein